MLLFGLSVATTKKWPNALLYRVFPTDATRLREGPQQPEEILQKMETKIAPQPDTKISKLLDADQISESGIA